MTQECPKCNGTGAIKTDPLLKSPEHGFHKLIEKQVRGGLKSVRDAHPEYFSGIEGDVFSSVVKRIVGLICADHIREDLLRFLREEDMLNADEWKKAVDHINAVEKLEDRR